jgi:hypothetical protein
MSDLLKFVGENPLFCSFFLVVMYLVFKSAIENTSAIFRRAPQLYVLVHQDGAEGTLQLVTEQQFAELLASLGIEKAEHRVVK